MGWDDDNFLKMGRGGPTLNNDAVVVVVGRRRGARRRDDGKHQQH